MKKKRYCLYLSRALANKFELVAMRRKRPNPLFSRTLCASSLSPKPIPGSRMPCCEGSMR